ncbi:MAG: alpha-glucosidase/alpha-galactosidase [Acidimicrobiales bacterium]|nr:MAG: alpha-glucosidase/alpha-galactosidase [Acidimicrobiales bacterium]
MVRIAFVGAGSTVFARNLIGDLIAYPELRDRLSFSLHDIDERRLRTSEVVANRIAATCDIPMTVEATTDRRKALEGADYVVTMFQVGGYEPSTVIDFEIPEKYGLQQTIADTLGVGGIMRGLRTVPVLVDVSEDISEVAGDAVFLNYANPMAINMWGLADLGSHPGYGLCHSIPLTASDLAHDLGIPADELEYTAAGINHMAFYLKLEHHGQNVYPKLKTLFTDPADAPRRGERGMPDAVRYEIMRRLGYFVAESSEHFAEYTPWFIKRDRPDLIAEFQIPLREYIRRCEIHDAEWDALRSRLEDESVELTIPHSGEFAPQIIHSIETDTQRTVYTNIPNQGHIDNLPDGCIVEVPTTVDGHGLSPQRVGALPPQLAAVIQTNVGPQALTVEALKTGDRAHVYHAAMLDPHTAAELSLEQIHNLVDDLLDAHGDYIPASLRDRT